MAGGLIMSARTARRRRKQAVMGYRHMARIGRGNDNRPIFTRTDAATAARKEAQKAAKRRELIARGVKVR